MCVSVADMARKIPLAVDRSGRLKVHVISNVLSEKKTPVHCVTEAALSCVHESVSSPSV